MGTGEYVIRWWAANPGSFTVFVKMDGLHVLGSPARMVLTRGGQVLPPRESVETPVPLKAVGSKLTRSFKTCGDEGTPFLIDEEVVWIDDHPGHILVQYLLDGDEMITQVPKCKCNQRPLRLDLKKRRRGCTATQRIAGATTAALII